MTTEEFNTYQEQTFDSFCKTVIRNESIDARRELTARADHETQLSALSVSDLSALCTADTYRPYRKTFFVHGNAVNVCDKSLSEALQFILPQQREVILLTYFFDYNDVEIGKLLGISNYAVRIRRNAALRHMHKQLESLNGE